MVHVYLSCVRLLQKAGDVVVQLLGVPVQSVVMQIGDGPHGSFGPLASPRGAREPTYATPSDVVRAAAPAFRRKRRLLTARAVAVAS